MNRTLRSASAPMLAAWVSVSAACFSWRMKDVQTLSGPLPESTEILSVVKISGEVVNFSKSNPGRLRGYTVVGVGKDPEMKPVELTGPFNIMKDAKERVYEVSDGKGQVYAVTRVLSQSADRMSVLASVWTPVSIPLAEVRQVQVKKSNALRNVAYVSGALVTITLLPLILAHRHLY
ncbi:MAG TPA: hypothetical protein VLJ16_04235 [Acidobacteriota bacterium]|nr:hypothetical protein [Acidobacteriota bacterium]